jgi:hypothetical protein
MARDGCLLVLSTHGDAALNSVFTFQFWYNLARFHGIGHALSPIYLPPLATVTELAFSNQGVVISTVMAIAVSETSSIKGP